MKNNEQIRVASYRLISFIFVSIFHLLCFGSAKSQGIVINEIMSSNGETISDKDGDFSDWIELYNPSDNAINLGGFGLSDEKEDPHKWVFPDIEIKPKGFLFVWASGKENDKVEELHIGFSISSSGETLILSDNEKNILDEFPSVELLTDYSFGRVSDGGNNLTLFSKPTPGISNSLGTTISGFTSEIVPSVLPGFYANDIVVDFATDDIGAQVFYTMDGSVPTLNSQKLDGSITITNRTSEENYYSMIPTTNHGGARGYQTPVGKVAKATIIRTLAVKDGFEPIEQSFTYFVFPNGADRYSLPVISIITEEQNLFSDDRGIFVPGNTYDGSQAKPQYTGNYFQRGDEWERPASLSLFDKDGDFAFSENVGLRIHGGITRHFPQKALRVYLRSEYGDNTLDYQLFEERIYKDAKRFLLRASGNDFGETYFRDAFAHRLVSQMDIDYQAYEPSIVFINGEYWGIHNIRERQDKYYLKNLYGVDPENVDILTGQNSVKEGDNEQYKFVLDLVGKLNKEDDNSITEIEKYIDLNNHIDYMIAQIYVANTDWPHNNIDFWRERTTFSPESSKGRDGRFRWMLYDTDHGLSHVNHADHNTLNWVTQEFGKEGWIWPNFLFRQLLGHKAYKERFINRFLDHLNTTFLPERANSLLEEMKKNIEPEIEEHLKRWIEPGSKAKWEEKVNDVQDFVSNRAENVQSHMASYFNVDNAYKVTLNTAAPNTGNIKLNSVEIKYGTPGVGLIPFPWQGTYFENTPIHLSPLPNEGYLFDHWLINGQKVSQEEIVIDLVKNTEITAVFSVDPVIKRKTIHYWFFGTDIENDVALTGISTIYSKNSSDNQLSYLSAIAPYPGVDSRGIMDRVNDPTPINFLEEVLKESGIEYSDMRGLRVRNPLQVEDRKAHIILNAPMDYHEEPILSAAVSRTNSGPFSIEISYRLSINENWTSYGLAESQFDLETEYKLISVDFKNIEGITDNPEFQIRIDFHGNTTSESGNARFNNISLDAFPLAGDDLITDLPEIKEDASSFIKKVYPNPTNDVVYLELVDGAHKDINLIQVLDFNGAEIIRFEEIKEEKLLVSLESLNSGLYVIKVNSNRRVDSFKILKR
ncbi:CotH kinase family protein [Echinicola sp. CAU 1574]|uniref:CotH kinase family protein n=1 Tax=Echinicola arenosa TaxID=2774144 RepID=A0ABR9AMF2_9BACT|nr:CotH kinase family protein [Echinicola arenosa]MBD8489080.1 CotH kinase family protein [Echinicola arenosa]